MAQTNDGVDLPCSDMVFGQFGVWYGAQTHVVAAYVIKKGIYCPYFTISAILRSVLDIVHCRLGTGRFSEGIYYVICPSAAHIDILDGHCWRWMKNQVISFRRVWTLSWEDYSSWPWNEVVQMY